ncbi:hypothetical protein [Azonexus sp. IMCC34839]|uniref:hypothetical protein n=1 Tax=Azonexus sp. IMCC34839 TaxID=3133695 RepID=UPI00399BF6D1
MSLVRRFLLVFVLVFAQWAAAAHGVEHAVGEGKGLPAHACEICLAAHDLGMALPSVVALPPVLLPRLLPVQIDQHDRGALPPPAACQRGPPTFF